MNKSRTAWDANVGVFVGASYSENNLAYSANTEKSGFVMLGSTPAMFSSRISYAFGFHGPSLTVDTACSSTMSALNQAMMSVRTGQCEAAIVGGCSLLLNPFTSLSYNSMGMLSKDGKCKAFDSNSQGFVRSEAVGVFFLQRASVARRVYARVLGVRANSDGYKNEGITFPSSKAQESLLRDTYGGGEYRPRTVAYVEAHGTGTKAGDTEELTAATAFFCQTGRKVPLKIGSVKSNVGHAEAASAVASLAKVIFALETDVIAGNLHFTEPIPGISALTDGRVEVVHKSMPFPGGPVGISSFGFGGVNGHAILEANPGPHVGSVKRQKSKLPRLVLMAGRNKDSLSKDISEVEQAPFEKRPLWFVFTGMGCQWKGMAREMMVFEVFANSIRKSHELLQQFDV
ncbi:hypothetical protein HPB48_023480 [Haemaphysalis longicornis]|uniref:Fatty acid synthase n=1 Tax=Haemaphysalis longicornis TaxID=44386 RepID=A0A9J6H576_HAELO|nr:hypothetical protein HPB48_023480 [Haemaphysalis longicornis]